MERIELVFFIPIIVTVIGGITLMTIITIDTAEPRIEHLETLGCDLKSTEWGKAIVEVWYEDQDWNPTNLMLYY